MAPATTSPITANAQRSTISLLGAACGHALIEIILLEIRQRHPREAHLVDSPLTGANPVFRVRIPLGGARVVVPGDDMDDRAGRKQGSHLVRVRIRDVPPELVV